MGALATTFGTVTLYTAEEIDLELPDLIRAEQMIGKAGAAAAEDILYPAPYPRERYRLAFRLVNDTDYTTLKGWALAHTEQTLVYHDLDLGSYKIQSLRVKIGAWHGQAGAGSYRYTCDAVFVKTT